MHQIHWYDVRWGDSAINLGATAEVVKSSISLGLRLAGL